MPSALLRCCASTATDPFGKSGVYRNFGRALLQAISDVPDQIDTVTVYLRPARSDPLIGEIVSANPKRIIMNPGAENSKLAARAQAEGIDVVEGCTLVMLRSGTF
jgi:predicted CoA-binding protein